MSYKHLFAVLAFLSLGGPAVLGAAVSPTVFTYQGLVQQSGSPISGSCDFEFSPWDAATDGSFLAPTQTVSSVNVSNGVFTVSLDFGKEVFDGEPRWLQIAVRVPSGTGGFTLLSPRQQVTAAPWALLARSANSVVASNLVGQINDAQLPTNVARLDLSQTFTGSNVFSGSNLLMNAFGKFTGDGEGLTNLNVANIVGWSTNTQSFTNVALLNASQTFTGSNSFEGVVIMSNPTNSLAGSFSGTFSGDGSGLTNVAGTGGTSNQPIPWTTVLQGSLSAVPNHGYLSASATQATVVLPASPAIGDIVRMAGAGEGTWKLLQGATNQMILTQPLGCAGGLYWVSNGPLASWKAITCSADAGWIVAVASNNLIEVSTDAGRTWTPTLTVMNAWESVASSADGGVLVAAGSTDGVIWTSTDGGFNWEYHQANNQIWAAVAISADGAKMVAAPRRGFIYTSSDAGQTWIAHASNSWSCVASSADGVRVVAGTGFGPLYTSLNSGTSWAPHGPTNAWVGVASSAEGNRLVAVDRGVGAAGGRIYTSANFGVSWTPRGPAKPWSGVACSSDGKNIFAVEDSTTGGRVYTSVDYGLTWSAHGPAQSWRCVASSSDGRNVVAAVSGETPGAIYTSGPTTTPGLEGGIIGGMNEAIELLYIGNNQFRILSHEGNFLAQ